MSTEKLYYTNGFLNKIYSPSLICRNSDTADDNESPTQYYIKMLKTNVFENFRI